MSVERESAREILGLKPGASAQEIKAAYRDLAKVWHPDRFSHDPRLQEKAQNKLKDINEAYEALTSASFAYSRTSGRGPNEPATHHAPPRSPSGGDGRSWTAMILIVCFVSFAFFLTIRLRQQREGNDAGQLSVTTTAPPVADEEGERKEAATNRGERKSVERQKSSASVSTSGATEQPLPVRAMPTATVTIDPTTGLLATTACPVKTSMTYVAGQEPHQHCSAARHPVSTMEAPPDSKNKSRLKSVLGRMAAPARWLKNKSREVGEPND